jgi:SAM-dependent methyltransferase
MPLMLSFPERFPPPAHPWTPEYIESHRALVSAVLDDPQLQQLFGAPQPLPTSYGVGFDERVVELPWLFAQPLRSRMLDAGSTLNQAHLVERLLPRIERLHIVTLTPEALAFTDHGISYVYEDLRDLPYRDGSFETVACVSTLEHIGMDNRVYGSTAPVSANPEHEAAQVLSELARVLTPGGGLFLTVPYGANEDHGWFRQYDRPAARALQETRGLELQDARVYAYSADGWQISDLDAAGSARYRDYHKDSRPVADLAAAARAVLCLSFIRSVRRSDAYGRAWTVRR